jgi:hypothetical protein
MAELKEQHVCIKFCSKPDINAVESFQLLKLASEHQPVARTQVFEWFSKCKDSVTSVDVDKCSRLLSVNKKRMKMWIE